MTRITKDTSLKDLASIVSTALAEAGIEAVLVGGAAVSIYSDNIYQTYDLDFVTRSSNKAISEVLEPLGFTRSGKGRHWKNSDTDFLVEFPGGDLNFGETNMSIESTSMLSTPFGSLRVITATQAVMDRLAAFAHWGDNQSYRQATLIVRGNDIDWDELRSWADKEGVKSSLIDELVVVSQ